MSADTLVKVALRVCVEHVDGTCQEQSFGMALDLRKLKAPDKPLDLRIALELDPLVTTARQSLTRMVANEASTLVRTL